MGNFMEEVITLTVGKVYKVHYMSECEFMFTSRLKYILVIMPNAEGHDDWVRGEVSVPTQSVSSEWFLGRLLFDNGVDMPNSGMVEFEEVTH